MDRNRFLRLQGLLEDIKKVDAMILLHATNDSDFMREQYLERKVRLTGYLIEELMSPEARSIESFSLISAVLSKFFPNLKREGSSSEKHTDWSEFEAMLA